MNSEIPVLDYEFGAHKSQDSSLLYSPNTIKWFSFFFSIIFGGILFSMNLKQLGKQKDIPAVLIICIIFLITQGLILSLFEYANSGLSIALNFAGGYFLSMLIWNRYIGKETVFKARKILVPLLIGIGISALLFFYLYVFLFSRPTTNT